MANLKKIFVHEWICPKCGSKEVALRRLTTIGKKSGCFCGCCRKTTNILVRESNENTNIDEF